MGAYHKLDATGSPDLTVLGCESIKGRVEEPLKSIYEDHLLFCGKCIKNFERT